MTPDQLIAALALIVEDCCQHSIKLRVAGKLITPEEWDELDLRWKTLRAMNRTVLKGQANGDAGSKAERVTPITASRSADKPVF